MTHLSSLSLFKLSETPDLNILAKIIFRAWWEEEG